MLAARPPRPLMGVEAQTAAHPIFQSRPIDAAHPSRPPYPAEDAAKGPAVLSSGIAPSRLFPRCDGGKAELVRMHDNTLHSLGREGDEEDVGGMRRPAHTIGLPAVFPSCHRAITGTLLGPSSCPQPPHAVGTPLHTSQQYDETVEAFSHGCAWRHPTRSLPANDSPCQVASSSWLLPNRESRRRPCPLIRS